jgi:FkbM family methyltransferase
MKQALKTIYSAVPFKRQLFSIIRLLHPPESVYKHLHFKGVFVVHVHNSSFKIHHNGCQVENDLFWRGMSHWESRSLKLWADLAKESNVILDVGANTGVYSLVAGAVNPNATICAFEPLKAVYGQLRFNISLNNFKIKAFEIAASNQGGETTFYTDNEFSYAGSVNKNHHFENIKELKVKCETLDDFITRMDILPDLIKIDVERHEPEVIEGFMSHIRKYHPSMLVEVLDERTGQKIRQLLRDSQYLYYSVNDKTGEIKAMSQMEKSQDFNVLVITEERAKKAGLF